MRGRRVRVRGRRGRRVEDDSSFEERRKTVGLWRTFEAFGGEEGRGCGFERLGVRWVSSYFTPYHHPSRRCSSVRAVRARQTKREFAGNHKREREGELDGNWVLERVLTCEFQSLFAGTVSHRLERRCRL